MLTAVEGLVLMRREVRSQSDAAESTIPDRQGKRAVETQFERLSYDQGTEEAAIDTPPGDDNATKEIAPSKASAGDGDLPDGWRGWVFVGAVAASSVP
jgi:glucose/arabinose dehydrogenase